MTKMSLKYLCFTMDGKEFSLIMLSQYKGRQSHWQKNMIMAVGRVTFRFHGKGKKYIF